MGRTGAELRAARFHSDAVLDAAAAERAAAHEVIRTHAAACAQLRHREPRGSWLGTMHYFEHLQDFSD